MRLIKCRNCGIKKPSDEIFRIVHVTSGGNKQNRNYCSEECYMNEQKEIEMLKNCQFFVDEILGYVCVNNQKNKSLKELCDAGYSRKQVYTAMLELKQPIIEGLAFRSDIENEGQKILYMYAIIRNKIKEITDRNNKQSIKEYNNDDIELVEEITYIKPAKNKPVKKSIMDIIKGGMNE